MKRSLVLHTSMRPRSIASGGNRMSTSPLKSRFRWKATSCDASGLVLIKYLNLSK
jgi:hypothetical protein